VKPVYIGRSRGIGKAGIGSGLHFIKGRGGLRRPIHERLKRDVVAPAAGEIKDGGVREKFLPLLTMTPDKPAA